MAAYIAIFTSVCKSRTKPGVVVVVVPFYIVTRLIFASVSTFPRHARLRPRFLSNPKFWHDTHTSPGATPSPPLQWPRR